MTEDFTAKVRASRIARAKAAVERADKYIRTHSNAATATDLIRDLREKLAEIVSEVEQLTAIGE